MFDGFDNITQVTTTFQDDSTNKRVYAYSDEDPTQLVRITNTHVGYPPEVDLVYDKNGRLVQDEEGRRLTYNSRSALVAVTDSTGKKILSKYKYDASGTLIQQEATGKTTYFFYRANALVAMIKDDVKISFVSNKGEYLGQISERSGSTNRSALGDR